MSRSADPGPEAWASTVVADNGADLLRYFARRHPGDAGDLLHETLAVIWRRRDGLPTNPVDARMWSFGVARNVSRRHHRRLRSRVRLQDALTSHVDVAAQPPTDPAVAAEERERDRDVRAALGRLRAADRELIVLVHWDGFSLADAAELLGLNPSTARTRYGRAKERLAVSLAPHRAGSLPAYGETGARDARRGSGPDAQDA
ncbi:MAG: RNA polymerase sigma factor [Microbacterium enclense]